MQLMNIQDNNMEKIRNILNLCKQYEELTNKK